MLRLARPINALILLTLLAILAIAATVSLILWDLLDRETEHARIETVSLTEMMVEQTENTFHNAKLILKGVEERLETVYGKQLSLSSLPVHMLLGTRIAGMESVRAIFILDAEGNLINSSLTHPTPKISLADRDYFLAIKNEESKEFVVGKPTLGRADNSWTIHVASRLKDTQGNFRGVVGLSLNLSYLEHLYDLAKLDFMRPVALYYADGSLVASLPHQTEALGKPASEIHGFQPVRLTKDTKLMTRSSENGDVETFTLVTLSNLPLMLSVTNSEQEALSPWRETARPIVIGAFIVGIFIIIVSGLLILELKHEESLARELNVANERYVQTVETTNAQLRELSSALQEVREEERTHISRELHDELGQQLTGLKLDLAWMNTRIKENRPVDHQRMDDMRLLLDNTIASVRRLSSDLRPPALDDLGFEDAVRWLANETMRRSNLSIEVDLRAAALVSDPAMSTTLFRIVQEALTNVIRHSNATHVAIRLIETDGRLLLTIADNGKGFNNAGSARGIGIVSMRERVVAHNGEFNITNTSQEGLVIHAYLPIQQRGDGKNIS